MKKLLIATIAAVSVGLCAKAEGTGFTENGTSFEGADEAGENGQLVVEAQSGYWEKDEKVTDEDLFTVTAAGEGLATVSRPDKWANSENKKVLAIDTSAPLIRNVNAMEPVGGKFVFPAQDVSTKAVFFDSVVQFTATDVAPLQEGEVLSASEGGNNVAKNKLMVWLYSSPEDVATTPGLFNEESAITKLVVTAGFLENNSTIKVKHYPTDVPVAPESWHRLTIKSFEEDDYLKFNVWVDGNPIKIGDATEPFAFDSMVEDGVTNYDKLQGVAFDGKGAVDDIVFTTDDPFAEPSYEVTVALSDSTAMSAGPTKYYSVDGGTTFVELKNADGELATGNDIVLAIPVDVENIVFKIAAYTGYKIDGGASAGLADGAWGTNGYTYWTKTVAISDIVGEGTSGTVSLSVVENTVIVEDPVAQIGETKYATLQAAVNAAEAGAEITVIAGIETDGPITVNKQVTIKLGGKTITATNDKSGDGVFHVVVGGNLTLEGDGTVNARGPNAWCMAVWADGGTVTINGGTYTNVGATSENDADHFDLIYVKNGGSVVINGGTFKCETPRWTLNKHNTTTGNFVVTGGKFFQYDPTNFDTDEAVTSWCPAGYVATLGEGDYYTVAEQTIKPVDPSKEDVVVTATSEPDALSKVELSVTVPDGVDAGKYKGYFKLSATDNGDGTWTVAAALDPEEVEPVIEATTDENGNVVTPAISFGSDGKVTINISNELPGLFYGVKYATTVGGVETAAAIPGLTVTPTAGDTAGFFRVVVDFKEIQEK